MGRSKMPYSRVYIEITNTCNKNCSFCPGTERKPKRLDERELSFILDKLSGYTEHVYFHVMGEPLSHPGLIGFIKLASERGFKTVITTNGSLLSRRAEELLSSGLYKINVSLHSFEDSPEEQVRYLDGVLDFIRRAPDAGILTVLRLWNKGTDGGRNGYVIERLRAEYGDGWATDGRGASLRDKLHLEYGERFDWPDINGEDLGDAVFCHGLGDHFGILSDGTVIPCCLDRDGVIDLGNVFDSDLEDILSGERATAMRRGFEKKHAAEELCRKCPYARRFKI